MKAKKFLIINTVILIILLSLSSCKNNNNQKEQIIGTIDEELITVANISIYYLRVKEEFEKLAGNEVWDIEDFSGGKTAEQVAKEGALDNLIRDKILDKKAKGFNVELNELQTEEITKKADDFFEKISDDIKEKNQISKEIVINTFKSSALANEVNQVIKNNFEPSEAIINEGMLANEDYYRLKNNDVKEILTLYVLKRIVIGEDESQKNGYEKALEAHSKINDDNFDEILLEYSDNGNIIDDYKVSLALLDEDFKTQIGKLSIGEVSNIIKTDQGYTVIKLIDIEYPTKQDILDYEDDFMDWEENLRKEVINKLQQEAFNQIYNEWKKDTKININNEILDKLEVF